MSLENEYRALMEATASRSTDQSAEVAAQGDKPTETPDQKKKDGDAQGDRKQDKKGTTVDAKGEAPKDVPAKVAVKDEVAPEQKMEAETVVTGDVISDEEMAEAAKIEEMKGMKKPLMASKKGMMYDDKDADEDMSDEEKKAKADKMKMEKPKMESATESIEVITPSVDAKIAESATFSLTNELGGLLEAEGLEADFKAKAIQIFEAAVVDASKSHVASLQEEAATLIHEEVEAYKITLDEQVEKYLDYVVVEWAKENKLAIQSQARNDISESFMTGLKGLLESHYIELPEDKVDMYEAEVLKTASVEKELTEQVNRVLELEKKLAEASKSSAVDSFVYEHALNDVEAEKIRSLAESVEFDSVDIFNTKLDTLKENYFPEKSSANADMIVEDVDGDVASKVEDKPKHDPEMQGYLDSMRGLSNRS